MADMQALELMAQHATSAEYSAIGGRPGGGCAPFAKKAVVACGLVGLLGAVAAGAGAARDGGLAPSGGVQLLQETGTAGGDVAGRQMYRHDEDGLTHHDETPLKLEDTNFPGHDIRRFPYKTWSYERCLQKCADNIDCFSVTYKHRTVGCSGCWLRRDRCYLKNEEIPSAGGLVQDESVIGYISGNVQTRYTTRGEDEKGDKAKNCHVHGTKGKCNMCLIGFRRVLHKGCKAESCEKHKDDGKCKTCQTGHRHNTRKGICEYLWPSGPKSSGPKVCPDDDGEPQYRLENGECKLCKDALGKDWCDDCVSHGFKWQGGNAPGRQCSRSN